MVRRYLLLSPGPTPVPQEVLLEGAKETIHHRTPEFVNILKETLEMTKYISRHSIPSMYSRHLERARWKRPW